MEREVGRDRAVPRPRLCEHLPAGRPDRGRGGRLSAPLPVCACLSPRNLSACNAQAGGRQVQPAYRPLSACGHAQAGGGAGRRTGRQSGAQACGCCPARPTRNCRGVAEPLSRLSSRSRARRSEMAVTIHGNLLNVGKCGKLSPIRKYREGWKASTPRSHRLGYSLVVPPLGHPLAAMAYLRGPFILEGTQG